MVTYYFKNKPYSQTITAHMNELRQLVKSSNAEKVKDIYNNFLMYFPKPTKEIERLMLARLEEICKH